MSYTILLQLLLHLHFPADEPPVPQAPLPLPSRQASLPDGDADFILQLRTQGLFDLARQVCLRKQQAASDPSAKIRWELLFTDCCEDEAWLLPPNRRHELIALAASRISDLLANVTPLPETELALRLRQLELLLASTLIESTALTLRHQIPEPKQLKFTLDACTSGLSLADQLLKFTEELRTTLNPQTLRDVRFRIRAATLELQLAQLQLTPPGPNTPNLLRQLLVDAENLVKGLAPQHLFRARLILARILLLQNDQTALQLQLRNLASAALSSSDHRQLEVLHHLHLLKLRQPSELLARDVTSDCRSDPELQTLRLHALLQLCELHAEIKLNRPPTPTPTPNTNAANTPITSSNDSLLEKATQNFQNQLAHLKPQLTGVWLERLSYAEQRLPIVLLAGPTAADSIESAAVLIQSGNDPAALECLRQITRLPSASNTLKALAQLQIGEILVRQASWAQALAELDAATTAFALDGNTQQQAAADLLRLFTLAQLHREATSSQPHHISAATAQYQSALDQHLQLFPNLPSAEFAREYRARLLQHSLPLAAAKDLLEIPTPPPEAPPERTHRHLRKLALLGCLLRQQQILNCGLTTPAATTHPDPGPNPSQPQNNPTLEVIRSAHATGIQAEIAAKHTQHHSELAVLQLQLLTTAYLITDNPTSPENLRTSTLNSSDWSQLLTELTLHLSTLNSPPPASDAFDFPTVAAHTLADALTLQLLASSRSLLPPERIQSFQQQLLALPLPTRRQQLLLLLPHLKNPSLPGNPALISFAAQLLPDPQQPGRSAASLLADLPITLQLAHTPNTTQLPAQLLNVLARHPLTPEQIHSAAAILATNTQTIPAADFWKQIQRQTSPGESAWLEAALQLASLAATQNRKSEALKILRTVSVLHPAWGSPERKQRATTLLKSLPQTP